MTCGHLRYKRKLQTQQSIDKIAQDIIEPTRPVRINVENVTPSSKENTGNT